MEGKSLYVLTTAKERGFTVLLLIFFFGLCLLFFYLFSMWYIYMLACATDEIYKGCTKNVPDRIRSHQNGEVESTRNKLPVYLLGYVAFTKEKPAFDFEKYLKSGSGRSFINKHFLKK
jgi:putative endonuclease